MKIKTIQLLKPPEGFRIPFFGGLLYRLLSICERRYIQRLPVEKLGLNLIPGKEKITVSLTSFPERIQTVGYAIKSLMNQSLKPDRMILWLAKEQFPDFRMPEILKQLCEKGLEIQFCDDLKAHKKYYGAIKNQAPDELVITYDDDLIYPEDSVERLYQKHLQYPHCIVCNRAGCCEENDGKFAPYHTWKVHSSVGVDHPGMRLFPSTGGGVLYPYNSVNAEVFTVEKIKSLAFTADDLWVRFMSALNGTEVIKTRKNHKTLTTLEGSQQQSLQVINCIGGENDRVLERLSLAYPEAMTVILKD